MSAVLSLPAVVTNFGCQQVEADLRDVVVEFRVVRTVNESRRVSGTLSLRSADDTLNEVACGDEYVIEIRRKDTDQKPAGRSTDTGAAVSREARPAAGGCEPCEGVRSRLATVVDEAFGIQPVMSVDDLLTFLERALSEQRVEHHRECAEVVTRERNRCHAWASAPYPVSSRDAAIAISIGMPWPLADGVDRG